VNDATADTIAQLIRQIEVLRSALTGRTMSCEWCNSTAKQLAQAEAEAGLLRAAIVEFVKWDSNGQQTRRWVDAKNRLHNLANNAQP
jgi:hypothetical protein